MVRVRGFEPPTSAFQVRSSGRAELHPVGLPDRDPACLPVRSRALVQLSYGKNESAFTRVSQKIWCDVWDLYGAFEVKHLFHGRRACRSRATRWSRIASTRSASTPTRPPHRFWRASQELERRQSDGSDSREPQARRRLIHCIGTRRMGGWGQSPGSVAAARRARDQSHQSTRRLADATDHA
jgi:hypothetical protein